MTNALHSAARVLLALLTLFPLPSQGGGLASCADSLVRKIMHQMGTALEPVEVETRNSDVDPYDHVNSTAYPGFLDTALSRWDAALTAHGEEAPERFEISDIDIDFQRAIPRTSIAQEPRIVVEGTPEVSKPGVQLLGFTIRNAGRNIDHARGTIYFLPKGTAKPPPALATNADTLPGEPEIYERLMDVRYNDLNRFNQLDFSQYLDLIVSSRWHYLRATFRLSASDFVKKGVGFFMTRAELHFAVPVRGSVSIRVRSWLSDITREGSELIIPFEIWSEDGATLHSNGVLTFAVMDLSARRRAPLPDWSKPYFFKPPQ